VHDRIDDALRHLRATGAIEEGRQHAVAANLALSKTKSLTFFISFSVTYVS
jgi:hypothetical protein